MKIKAYLIAEQVTSNTQEAQNLQATQKLGEKQGEKITYSLMEAFHLLTENKMELYNAKNKLLTKEEIEKKFENIDKTFKTKYAVYKDLQQKGYLIKSALKFGAEFRVYEKGKNPGKEHSTWILFPTTDREKFSWQNFVAKNRIAHSTKKKLLIAIVDEEQAVTYFEVAWKKT